MKNRLALLLVFVAVMLVGCATPPQQPISLSDEVVGARSGRIGVVMTPLPKVDTQLPGTGCLLCIAAAAVANSSLTSHAQTLPYEDIPNLKKDITGLLRNKGADAVEIPEDLIVGDLPDFGTSVPNAARKDYSALRKKYGIDKLLVIDITTLGFIRTYSSYIPTSAPKANLLGVGYMVNLKTNTYDWYKPVQVVKSSDQNWDEPPKFPGLTNAYFQALEIGMDNFRQPFVGSSSAAVNQFNNSPITRATQNTSSTGNRQ